MTSTRTAPAHDGPCSVMLDIWLGSTELTPRALLDRAIVWADGLDEFADLLPPAREVLGKPNIGRTERTSLTREQFDAAAEVVEEFGAYAEACGYADEDDEDAEIARCLTAHGRISTWLLCDVPVVVTESWTDRWDVARAREIRYNAHEKPRGPI